MFQKHPNLLYIHKFYTSFMLSGSAMELMIITVTQEQNNNKK